MAASKMQLSRAASRRARKQLSQLRSGLGFNASEFKILAVAARDCHLGVVEYSRLMLLAAAGMGGSREHLDRVIDASIAEDRQGVLVLVD